MTNLFRGIHLRELTARALRLDNYQSGLRSYRLFEILPHHALEDVFLGFSVCGRFLISYKHDCKQFFLRFWLFPPTQSDIHGHNRLELFAETSLSRVVYATQIHDVPSVRFIQSHLNPSTFVILSSDFYGGGVISAFGCMPDVECTDCVAAGAALCRGCQNTASSPRCPFHTRLLPIYLDLPNPLSPKSTGYDRSRKRRKRSACPADLLPACFAPQTSGIPGRQCSCFAQTKTPISLIQISVCNITGSVRIAWPSPDAQVKVLTCSFESTNHRDGGRSHQLHLLPEASSLGTGHALLTYIPPLLLHNYCSNCYSWPSSRQHPCDETIYDPCHTTPQSRPQCVFARPLPILTSVQELEANSNYPCKFADNATSATHHNCFATDTKLPPPTGSFQPNENLSFRYPALLSGRRKLLCCIHINYLAMLQNVRASYVLWTLVSRPPQPRRRESSVPIAMEDDTLDNSSASFSESASDPEPLGLSLEPVSSEDLTSPEDLLAHRLSGQTHTSFDLTEWEEVKPSNPAASSTHRQHAYDGRTIAYLEEVVFDLPAEFVDDEKDSFFESNQLAVFVPPEEQNLLLVYRRLNEDMSENAYEFLDEINLSTGERRLLTHYKSCDGDLSRLRDLVLTCPSRVSHTDRCSKGLIHELNNMQMTVHSESLKLLTDPQGGYAVYL
ncbi:unnamed protein product [Dicrocoelium dendriticum]|nr:unnamed protein product [Dicrocoelium dendriticum]